MVIETPQSQNVSVGQEVVFTCATTDSVSIFWDTMPTIAAIKQNTETLPGGGKREFLTVNALEGHNNTIVTCIFVTGAIASTHTALLLVQGEFYQLYLFFS